jgi:hypothetical protein
MLKDTDERDNTQVMFKWAKEQDQLERKQDQPTKGRQSARRRQTAQFKAEGDYPILMVDQLWLWVLKDANTVVACFPNTWEPDPAFNLVRHCLENHIAKNDNRQAITSAMDLANEIIRCSIDFMRRTGPKNLSPRMFPVKHQCDCKCRAHSALRPCGITATNVDKKQSESQATLFREFKVTLDQLRGYKDLNSEELDELTDELLWQNKGMGSLAEILDIQDELKIIKDVFSEQKEALDKFCPLVAAPRVHFDDSNQPAKDNVALVDSNILAAEEMMKYADKLSIEVSLP